MNSRCFENNHMTCRQFGLWNRVRTLQRKWGFLFFDGDDIAAGFQSTSRDVIFNECKALLGSGWFELMEPRQRKNDGTWSARKIKAVSHEEWVVKHPNKCLQPISSCTGTTGESSIQSLPYNWTEGDAASCTGTIDQLYRDDQPVVQGQPASCTGAIDQSLPYNKGLFNTDSFSTGLFKPDLSKPDFEGSGFFPVVESEPESEPEPDTTTQNGEVSRTLIPDMQKQSSGMVDWSERVPSGKLTMFAGHPDIGKSTLTALIAARLSTGWWTGVQGEPHDTLFISSEDSLAETVVPRLIAAGADRGRVIPWEDRFLLTADISKLNAMLQENPSIELVVIDPLMNHIGSGKAERLLPKLKAVAKDRDVAIVLVTHLDKQVRNRFGDRAASAMGYTTDVESIYELREKDGRRRMQSLVEDFSLNYTIESCDVGLPDPVGRIDFGEVPPVLETAKAFATPPEASPEAMPSRWGRCSDMKVTQPPPKDGLVAYMVMGVGWVHATSYKDAEQRVRPQYEAYLNSKCVKAAV